MSRDSREGVPARAWRLARRAADDPVVRMVAVALLQVAATRIEQSGGRTSTLRACGEGACKAGQLT